MGLSVAVRPWVATALGKTGQEGTFTLPGVYRGMKTIRSLIAVLLLAASSLLTSVPPLGASTPADPSAQAVASCVEAATDEINTIRTSAEASKQARPEEQRSRYREFERKRKAGDQLITGLSSATPGNFDSIKVKHERARARPSPHSGALSRLELDASLSMESALVPFQRCRP